MRTSHIRQRLHPNVLAIALANKLARIAWSVLARGRATASRRTSALPPNSEHSLRRTK